MKYVGELTEKKNLSHFVLNDLTSVVRVFFYLFCFVWRMRRKDSLMTSHVWWLRPLP